MDPDRSFSVVVCHDNGRSLVRVNGDIDAAASPTLCDALLAFVDVGERDIDIDLSGVTFIDSTGIGVIVDVLRAGADLTVVGASLPVRRLLDLTGLTALDNLHEDLAESR